MNEMLSKVYKVELLEPESLLRKNIDNDLVLVKYNCESFVEIGGNYSSTMFKVDAIIKRKNDAKEEELHLVAKMLPPSEFQRTMFNSEFIFKKEAFMYEELIPSYQRLEREFGIKEVINIAPKFYGIRYSLQPDVEFDDNVVILMQNLKVLGYYTVNRQEGLDFEHAKIAVKELAHFHALGMAMKHHKPDYFEKLKERSKFPELKNTEMINMMGGFIKKMIMDDSEMSAYGEPLNTALSGDLKMMWLNVPTEPWSTIAHMDFWINNIMFRDDSETKKVIDVKFVDFQNYLFMSPLRELAFFLTANLNTEVMDNKFDELIDCYYENLTSILKNTKCNMELYSRDKFDKQLKIDAYEEFLHCPFMINLMTVDSENVFKPGDMEIFNNPLTPNPLFIERMRKCVKKYAEKGWLYAKTKQ